ncbi:MAG: OsmC family protein [Nitrososphaerota archaeon]
MSNEAKSDSLTFNVSLRWDHSTGAEAFTKGGAIRLDMPKDFGGLGRYPCPDEVFLSALGGCMITTFIYFQRRLGAKIDGMEVSVDGEVKLDSGGYRITNIKIKLKVLAESPELEKVTRCAKLAIEYCHLTRSIKPAIAVMTEYEVISPNHS